MTYIKNQILQNNALEAWAMSIRYCDYILEGKATLEYRKHFVSALHNAVELSEIENFRKQNEFSPKIKFWG